MTLDARLEDLGNLDDGLATHYTEKQDDGFHYLDVDSGDSGLVLENVDNLKSALEKQKEETANHVNVDDAKIADAVTAAVTEAQAANEKKLVDLTADLANHKGQLTEALIDNQINRELAAQGGNPALLMLQIKNAVTLERDAAGKFVETVRDEKGNIRVDSNGDNITLKSYISELRANPEFGGAFKGTGSSGAGKRGGDSSNNKIATVKKTAKRTDGVVSIDPQKLAEGGVEIED